MSDEEPDVQETPQGHKIPVPNKADVLATMRKVANAKPPKPADDGSDARGRGAEEK